MSRLAGPTEGDDAAFLLESYGLKLDEWQRLVLREWLAVDGNRWAHTICGLTVPRQNGKSALLEAICIYSIVVLRERVLFTAHEMKTARQQFIRMAGFFENDRDYPELCSMVDTIRRANGQEGIYLRNGGSVEFIARSKSSGRGYSADKLLGDEAQEFSGVALASLLPTISASRNRQQIYVGTVPAPEANSEVFTGLRDKALSGTAERMSWIEWSAPADCDLDSKDAWVQANPAAGIRLELETIADERSVMDDDTFARERIGIWTPVATGAVIDAQSWGRVADAASQIDGDVSFAVDITPNRDMASIAVCGLRGDGLHHVEVIECRRGTEWVVPRLVGLVGQWSPVSIVVDGPAATLVPELDNLRVPVWKTNYSEFGTACGIFFDYVMSQRLRHPNQPLFNYAVEAARRRPIGDLWAWGRKNTEQDITPIVAATLALYGFLHAEPSRRRRTVEKPRGGKVLVM